MSALDREAVARRIFAMRALGPRRLAKALDLDNRTFERIVCGIGAVTEAVYRQLLPRLEAVETAYRETGIALPEGGLDAYRERRRAKAVAKVGARVAANEDFKARICADLERTLGPKRP